MKSNLLYPHSPLLRSIEKKRGASAHFEEEEFAAAPVFQKLMLLAQEKFHDARQHQRTGLLKAKECGEFLNEAKRLWKTNSSNRWKKKLKEVFGDACRTAQEYMQVAAEWPKIEPLLKKHPDLSIAGALRFIRHGTVETKEKFWDPVRFANSRAWAKIKNMWGRWPKEAQAWLYDRPDLIQDLLLKLVRENAEPKEWRKYVPPELRDQIKWLSEKEERERAFKAARQEKLNRPESLLPEPSKPFRLSAGIQTITSRSKMHSFPSQSQTRAPVRYPSPS